MAGKQKEVGNSIFSKPFTARLGASASNLAWSAFSQPSAATDALAALPDGESKAAASSSTSRIAAGSNTENPILERHPRPRRVAAEEPFRQRSDQIDKNIQADFDGFVNSKPEPNQAAKQPSPYSEVSFKQRRNLEWPYGRAHEASSNFMKSKGIDMDHADQDGAAVVELLSRPGIPSEETPAATWAQYPDRKPTIQSRDNLQFGPNQLNIYPKVVNEGELTSMVAFLESHGVDMALYHDEVWGDHLLQVQEAFEEIQESRNDPNTIVNERPAVRRLKLLLQHLDDHRRR